MYIHMYIYIYIPTYNVYIHICIYIHSIIIILITNIRGLPFVQGNFTVASASPRTCGFGGSLPRKLTAWVGFQPFRQVGLWSFSF